MNRNKHRKKDGWVFPDSTIKAPKKEIIEECLEPDAYWDDWGERRDGQRGYDDKTRIRPKWMRLGEYFNVAKWNRKLKILLRRRKYRKRRRIW